MGHIEILFYELIRVSIGNQDYLSRRPSNSEWKALYNMAKKQSLVGVCFAALQRLGADADEGFERIGMSDSLYFDWMSMAATIQKRNEIVNRQCAELQTKLKADELRSCILKGQSVAQLYAEHLHGLRQSGDIDIWIEGDRDKALNYFKKLGAKVSFTSIKHAQVEVYEDTDVEVHSRPSWFYSPIHDRRWMKWVKKVKNEQFNYDVNGIIAPTIEFNLVFLLIHIYRHLFEEGIGLRQIMDYFFVLTTRKNYNTLTSSAKHLSNNEELSKILSSLGLMKFAGSLMFVMSEVFGLDKQLMICPPNEKDGRLLLEDIMIGGNFGKYDERNGKRKANRIARGFATMKRNMRYISAYPSEILWAPAWKMWHWCWRKKHGYI